MFALVRNDDGYPVIIEIFPNKDAAEKAKNKEGCGHYIREISKTSAVLISKREGGVRG